MLSTRFLGLSTLLLAAPALAQTGAKMPSASPVPLGIAALGGLVLGALLGAALKKTPPPAPLEEKDRVFDEVPLPLAVLDGAEKILRANAAFGRLFGVAETQGTPLPDFFHPDDLAANRTLLHEVLGGDREGFSVQTHFFRPDGSQIAGTLSARKQGMERKPKTILVAIEDATARLEAERELEGARGAIHALYEVIAGDKSLDFDGHMKGLLAMGCQRFNLEIGAISRFLEEDGVRSVETLYVQSSDRRIRPRLIVPVVGGPPTESGLLGLDKAPHDANWRDFPFVAAKTPHSLLGAPLLVSGKLFGMLTFASFAARETALEPGEIELLQLLAEWVGGEFERETARVTLEAQQAELLAANTQLEALATHDSLTELKNRRAFNDKLAEEWSRATRYATALTVIMLDVDSFKSFNDTYGHPAGDEVLKKVARILAASVRGTDFVARYGGEEFILILPNTDAEGALILAERLRIKVERGPWQERDVTASFGIASLTGKMADAAALTQAADEALYASKAAGRNRTTVA